DRTRLRKPTTAHTHTVGISAVILLFLNLLVGPYLYAQFLFLKLELLVSLMEINKCVSYPLF
ncbi:MAG: hypothetical protein ACK48F_15215, partial [Chryseotalea sp.]